jgi:hypothetical protein
MAMIDDDKKKGRVKPPEKATKGRQLARSGSGSDPDRLPEFNLSPHSPDNALFCGVTRPIQL